jgi:50S ribosomal subunit-associated GTPase HflX
MREEQKAQVEKVLAELAVSTKPVIQVLNKVDLLPAQELAHSLQRSRGDSCLLAAAHRP